MAGAMNEAAVLARWVSQVALGEVPASEAEAPGRVLASLLDLRGAVALVRHLSEPAAARSAASTEAREVRAQLRAGSVAVSGRLEEDLASMFKARYRLPTAERAWAILVRAEAHTQRKGAALKNATRALWAPCHDFFDTRIKRARFALRDLRDELGPALAGLGPAAERLERVDRGLELATRTAADDLLRRGMWALENRFATEVRALVRSLPTAVAAVPSGVEPELAEGTHTASEVNLPPLPLVVARAFGSDGFFEREMALGRDWVRAQVSRDQRRLQALVEGAAAARSGRRG